MLTHPSTLESVQWRHVRIGRLTFVVHPTIAIDVARAAATAKWALELRRRFALRDTSAVT